MEFGPQAEQALRDLLIWRRDVRQFRPTPIADDVVEHLRATMDLAPSVGNARPWRVLRIDSPSLRAAVRAEFERCNAEAAALDFAGPRQVQYRALKLAGLDTAPLQLAVFTHLDPHEGHRLGRRTLPATLEQSTSMAIHTLWLAARAANLGLGMVSILDPAALERICDVPETWRFSAYLCLGHAETTDDQPLLHRLDWQENTQSDWIRR